MLYICLLLLYAIGTVLRSIVFGDESIHHRDFVPSANLLPVTRAYYPMLQLCILNNSPGVEDHGYHKENGQKGFKGKKDGQYRL